VEEPGTPVVVLVVVDDAPAAPVVVVVLVVDAPAAPATPVVVVVVVDDLPAAPVVVVLVVDDLPAAPVVVVLVVSSLRPLTSTASTTSARARCCGAGCGVSVADAAVVDAVVVAAAVGLAPHFLQTKARRVEHDSAASLWPAAGCAAQNLTAERKLPGCSGCHRLASTSHEPWSNEASTHVAVVPRDATNRASRSLPKATSCDACSTAWQWRVAENHVCGSATCL